MPSASCPPSPVASRTMVQPLALAREGRVDGRCPPYAGGSRMNPSGPAIRCLAQHTRDEARIGYCSVHRPCVPPCSRRCVQRAAPQRLDRQESRLLPEETYRRSVVLRGLRSCAFHADAAAPDRTCSVDRKHELPYAFGDPVRSSEGPRRLAKCRPPPFPNWFRAYAPERCGTSVLSDWRTWFSGGYIAGGQARRWRPRTVAWRGAEAAQ